MKRSKILTLLWAVLAAVVVLTGAIAAPILCRSFYYAHIDALDLTEQIGLSETEIRRAYNEMMDYCTGGDTFSTGILPHSQEGASHFADVRSLFLLDLGLLAGSVAACVVLFVLTRLLKRRCAPILGRGPGFWAGAGLGVSFAVIGGLAPWTLTGPLWSFTTCSSPAKTTGSSTPTPTPLSSFFPRCFSATVPF